MRRIIRRLELIADDVGYGSVGSGGGEGLVLPLSQWLALDARERRTVRGVLLGPADEIEVHAPELTRSDLIVVDFPKVGEGRGYSQARLLRQRFAFRGELRARGALKRDQLLFLARCGFDSFDLDPGEDLEAALAGFRAFTVAYQDGIDTLIRLNRRGATSISEATLAR